MVSNLFTADQWITAAQALVSGKSRDQAVLRVFCACLKWIHVHQCRGGCHDTAAVMYILLSELGLSPVLRVGEVRYGNTFFDHSWVAIDRKVYDAAISMPNVLCVPNVPVFASIDLATGEKTLLDYGAISSFGYDDIGDLVSRLTLGEYSRFHPDDPDWLWNFSRNVGKYAGIRLNVKKIRKKYSRVHRSCADPDDAGLVMSVSYG